MPALFREINKFTVSGGGDIAVFGWWLFTPGDWSLAELGSDIALLDDDSNWWENTSTAMARHRYSGNVAWADRYLERIDIDSGAVLQTLTLAKTSSLTGASSAAQLPAEVSCCVSVRSGFSDKSGNGRFYLPPPASDNLSGVGAFTIECVTELAIAFQAYFNAIHAGDVAARVGTYSMQDHAFVPAATINVGTIPDSQRRRRNKLSETRVVEPIT